MHWLWEREFFVLPLSLTLIMVVVIERSLPC
jgi:hypothetical protein